MSKVKVGRVVKAKVTGITEYGAFVSVNNRWIGLIHISEMSSHYVKNIEDYLKEGDEIYCKVLEILDDNKHLKLTIRGIDYQISGKKRNMISETKRGFNTLKDMLPRWIRQTPKK